MSYLMKFTLAIFLGVVAAAGNWFYMMLQTQPTEFVAIANSLKVGQEIDENDLTGVPIPGDPNALRKSLIPYANRSILFGRKATRAYFNGDLVLSRDLVADASDAEWDVIGPFELISVGDRFKQMEGRELTIGSTRGDTVTIAVDANFDAQTSRLLSVIAGQATDSTDAASEILAVQVVPTRVINSGLRTPTVQPTQPFDMVYQTVSLQGIANVPAVLLEGDFIRFVVPKSTY